MPSAPAFDPNNIHEHEPGSKLDGGKIKPRLIVCDMSRALRAVSEVATYGADKYSEGGWMHVPDAHKRYTDALIRHLLAEAAEGDIDAESGLLHASHLAWNALARLELKLR